MEKYVLSFLFGCVALSLCHQLPVLSLLIASVLIIFLAWLIWPWTGLILVASFGAGLGYSAWFASQNLAAHLPAELLGQRILVQGKINSIPQKLSGHDNFVFKIYQISGVKLKNPALVVLNWYRNQHQIYYGQTWELMLKLRPVHNLANLASYDREKYYFAHNWQAQGQVANNKRAQLRSESAIGKKFGQGRELIAAKIQSLGIKHYQIIAALLLGKKELLDHSSKEIFKLTGTQHLLAISGLHIGMIYFLVYYLFFRLYGLNSSWCLAWPAQKFSSIAAWMFSGIFAVLTGFSLPTQRAFLMLSLLSMNKLFYWNLNIWKVLALTVLIILLLNPMNVLLASFWLSFWGTVILCALGSLQYPVNFSAKFWILLKQNCGIFILMLPCLAYFFNSVYVASYFANLLAVPLTDFLVLPSLLILLFSLFIPIVNHYTAVLANFSVQILLGYLQLIADLKLPNLVLSGNGIISLLSGSALFFGIWWQAIIGKIIFAWYCWPLFYRPVTVLTFGQAKFTIFDLRQEAAVLIQTKNRQILYELVRKRHRSFDDLATLQTYFNYQQIKKIDLLIFTYPAPHSGQNWVARSENISIQNSLPLPELRNKLQISTLGAQNWVWDGINFMLEQRCVDASYSLKIKAGEKKVFLGTPRAWQNLCQQTAAEKFSILILTAVKKFNWSGLNLEKILDVKKIITGAKNFETQPFKDLSPSSYTTAQQGALEFTLQATAEIKIAGYRAQHPGYWVANLPQ